MEEEAAARAGAAGGARVAGPPFSQPMHLHLGPQLTPCE